jgi:ferrochelatase
MEVLENQTNTLQTTTALNQKSNPRTGVLLVNLGTPDSPSVPDVRKYLREFLMDARVVDVPFLLRFVLVNGIIAPFRSPKSAKIYKQLWTDKGSPLKFYGEELTNLVQQQLGEEYLVVLAMRYQNPSIEAGLKALKDKGLQEIIVLPLFPQYASATTGSVYEKVMDVVSKWQIFPNIRFISDFFENPKFLEAFAENGKKYLENHSFDHVIFSYHGLPERQIRKSDCTGTCLSNTCCDTLTPMNRQCYRAACFATSRLLAEKLNLSPENYSVTFQSRLGKDPWIQPYTDETIEKLAAAGKKNVLTFSPAFVADCLETTIEIGEEYKELFEEKGGKHWQLVESLNVTPLWIETVVDLVKQYEVAST